MGKFNTHGGYFAPKNYFKVNEGGSHDENPNGGVQIGVDEQGVPNMLEEGEPVYNDYVYSDNITADEEILKKYNIPVKYAGKLYSQIADAFVDEAEDRPLDPISNNGLNAMLVRLADAQEEQKAVKAKEDMEAELANLSPEELAQLEQELAAQQQAEEEQAMQAQALEQQQAQQMQMSPEEEQMMAQQQMAQENAHMMQQPMMACGGKLRRYDDGGDIPPTFARDNTRTPLNLDYGVAPDPFNLQFYDPKRARLESDVMSMIPIIGAPAAIANATDDWDNKKYGSAILEGVSAIPVAGTLLKGAKFAIKAPKVIRAARAFSKGKKVMQEAEVAANKVAKLKNAGKDFAAAQKVADRLADKAIMATERSEILRDVAAGRKTAKEAVKEITKLDKSKPANWWDKTKAGSKETLKSVFVPGHHITRSIKTSAKKGRSTLGTVWRAAANAPLDAGAAVADLWVANQFLPVNKWLKQGYDWASYMKPMPVNSQVISGGNFGVYDENSRAYGGPINRFELGGPEDIDPITGLPRSEYSSYATIDNDRPIYDRRYSYLRYLLDTNNAGLAAPDVNLDFNDPANIAKSIKAKAHNGRSIYAIQPTRSELGMYATAESDALRDMQMDLDNGLGMMPRISTSIKDPNFKVTTTYNPTDITKSEGYKKYILGQEKAGRMALENAKKAEAQKALPIWPRYAGIALAGLRGLYNAFQKPDRYNIPMISPVLPEGQMDLIDPIFNPLDENQAVNDVLASGAGSARYLSNNPASLLALDYNLGKNIGAARINTWDANNQRRNQIIAQRNANGQALGAFNYGISKDRASILNDFAYKNLQNDLTRQRLNYASEQDKANAVNSGIDAVAHGLAGIGRENFAMNQINLNEALDYMLRNGYDVTYKGKRITDNLRRCGGTLLRKYKK